MLNDDEIDIEVDTLTPTQIDNWLIRLRTLPMVKTDQMLFTDIGTRLTQAAAGSVKAQYLNALDKKLRKIKSGELEVRGYDDAVWMKQRGEREALYEEALTALYIDSQFTGNAAIIGDKAGYGTGAALAGARPDPICQWCMQRSANSMGMCGCTYPRYFRGQ